MLDILGAPMKDSPAKQLNNGNKFLTNMNRVTANQLQSFKII